MNEDHKLKKETRFFKTVKMLNGTHSNALFMFELLGSLMDTTQNDHWNLQEQDTTDRAQGVVQAVCKIVLKKNIYLFI